MYNCLLGEGKRKPLFKSQSGGSLLTIDLTLLSLYLTFKLKILKNNNKKIKCFVLFFYKKKNKQIQKQIHLEFLVETFSLQDSAKPISFEINQPNPIIIIVKSHTFFKKKKLDFWFFFVFRYLALIIKT